APRLYRVPLSLRVAPPAGVEKREALIVLNRRGIARIVPEGTAQPVLPAKLELPELDDNGVELLPQAGAQRAPVRRGPAPSRERAVRTSYDRLSCTSFVISNIDTVLFPP